MNSALTSIFFIALGQISPSGEVTSPVQAKPHSAVDTPAPFVVTVGDNLRLTIPRDETLTYQANVSLAFVDAAVGEVIQVSKVESYKRSLLLRSPANDSQQELAKLEISAIGSYMLFEMKTIISARHLPQAWPAITYDHESFSPRQRRRQNLIGTRDGKSASSSRRDTSNGAPDGARIWREPSYRDVPENTIDMLSAVLLTRTLIGEGLQELRFPMVEKDRLWEVVLTRGDEVRMHTPAGTFDVIEVLLKPSAFPDETIEAEKLQKFEGLFGIHGTIHLFVEKNTGVPIRIQGDLPAGPMTLGMDVRLKSFKGTPEGFTVLKDEN